MPLKLNYSAGGLLIWQIHCDLQGEHCKSLETMWSPREGVS